MEHGSITDRHRGLFRYDQAIGGDPAFKVSRGTWRWEGSDRRDPLEFSVQDYDLSLDLTASKPPVVHQTGFTALGQASDSFYYSRTRLELSGTLNDQQQRKEVTGEGWFDHQWGNFLPEELDGWDWFGIQLEDGDDLTLALIRGDQEEVLGGFGTYITQDGDAQHIEDVDMEIQALRSWTSPATEVTYPADWRLVLPDRDIELICLPVLQDQELDVRETSGMSYWEGQVRCEGTRDGDPLTGSGYVELIGYDRP